MREGWDRMGWVWEDEKLPDESKRRLYRVWLRRRVWCLIQACLVYRLRPSHYDLWDEILPDLMGWREKAAMKILCLEHIQPMNP
jgi:hypothetical protein